MINFTPIKISKCVASEPKINYPSKESLNIRACLVVEAQKVTFSDLLKSEKAVYLERRFEAAFVNIVSTVSSRWVSSILRSITSVKRIISPFMI